MSGLTGDPMTLAEVIMGMSSRVLTTLGTAGICVGVIHVVNRMTGFGIDVLNSIPGWLNNTKGGVPKDDAHSDLEKKTISRQDIINEATAYGKIVVLIIVSLLIKGGGIYMADPNTTKTINAMLYGNK